MKVLSPPSLRKEVMHSSGALVFSTTAQETSPGHLGLWPVGFIYVCDSIRLYIFTIFKSCRLLRQFPVSNQPDLGVRLPFGTLIGVGIYPQLLEDTKNDISCLDNFKGLRDNQARGQG